MSNAIIELIEKRIQIENCTHPIVGTAKTRIINGEEFRLFVCKCGYAFWSKVIKTIEISKPT